MEQHETRLSYSIKACSTESPGYAAENLQELVSTGWRSSDLCDFPQSIICKLECESLLRKIQLLGHNFLIPQRVVLYIGNFNNKYEKHIWKKIGFVTFSDNANTSYKQRELKTINLKDMDISGQYIKFEVYQNHANKKNIFNQVAIDAINFMGAPKPDLAKEMANRYLKRAERENIDPNGDSVNKFGTTPTNSTSPHGSSPHQPVGLDEETKGIIHQMKAEKRLAEEKEDFDLAAAFKVTIEVLTTLGEQIWTCDHEKRRCVSEEKYDQAKGFKIRRDEMKLRRDRQIDENLYQFGFSVDYFVERDAHSNQSVVESTSETTTTNDNDNGYLEVKSARSDEKKSIVDFEIDQPQPEVPHYRYELDDEVNGVSYDERQVGAHHKTFDELLTEELEKEKAKGNGQVDVDLEDKMDEKNRRENQQFILVFGERFVQDAVSKKHNHRTQAVEQMRQIMIDKSKNGVDSREEQRDFIRACNHFVVQFLQDGVKEVYLAGLELIPLLIHFAALYHGQQSDVNFVIESILPILLKRSSEAVPNLDDARAIERSKRTNEILDATVNLGTLDSVSKTAIYFTKTFAPFATETKGRPGANVKRNVNQLSPKQTWARLEIVYKIIRQQQTLLSKHWKTEQLFENTFQLIEIGIKHSNSCVREKAKDMLKFLYRVNDERTREMFDIMVANDKNNKQIREKIVNELIDDFDRIDGKPTKKELEERQKRLATEEQARKEAEVAELQKKLAEMKALTKQAEQSKQAFAAPAPSKGAKSPQPAKDSLISESMASADEANDKTCIFCGEFNENFDGAGLDVHYWKHCPMLKRCEKCKMVVEISGYSAHLLDECEQKDAYVECPICNEAFLAGELKQHQQNKKVCIPRKPGKVVCTLCHEELDDSEHAWRDHLMGPNGCTHNKRRLESLKRTGQATQHTR